MGKGIAIPVLLAALLFTGSCIPGGRALLVERTALPKGWAYFAEFDGIRDKSGCSFGDKLEEDIAAMAERRFAGRKTFRFFFDYVVEEEEVENRILLWFPFLKVCTWRVEVRGKIVVLTTDGKEIYEGEIKGRGETSKPLFVFAGCPDLFPLESANLREKAYRDFLRKVEMFCYR